MMVRKLGAAYGLCVLLGLLAYPPLANARFNILMWSGAAHADMVQIAFKAEREDCRTQMREGSEWVDSLPNQLPAKAYMHAMRSGADQTLADARSKMAGFIQSNYEQAFQLKKQSTQSISATPSDPFAQLTHDGLLITNMKKYLQHCYFRGVGLHPVMDSTSPVHSGFAIWSITDLDGMLKHGDLPHTLENDLALARNNDVLKKTVGLMRVTDRLYLELKQLDYRFGE